MPTMAAPSRTFPLLLASAICVMLPLAACGPPEQPLMAKCKVAMHMMNHGDPRWTELENFGLCMSSEDYHLVQSEKCMAIDDPDDPVSPTPNAVQDPDCWHYISSNWP
jgi:hypothetical protein